MSLRDYLAPTARETYDDAILAEITTRQCAEQAHEILTDAERLQDHDANWELWTGKDNGVMESALARCFRELDAACKGDPVAVTAITTALSNLYRDWRETITRQLEGQE